MKLALFFFLSCAVHGTAFLVPIALNGRTPEAIAVTILPLEAGPELNGGAEPFSHSGAEKSTRLISLPGTNASVRGAGPSAPTTAAPASPPIAADKTVGETSAGAAPIGVANRGGEGSANSGDGGSDNFITGNRFAEAGNGNGEGVGAAASASMLVQARYRVTPQPHYPDSARRQGKEGRVLLRVLVDEEGSARAIEISASSGHDMLDQAAREALKKWRFVPAHANGKPVETWVKIPIEFQLSNANR